MKRLQPNQINFLDRLREARIDKVAVGRKRTLILPLAVAAALVIGVWLIYLVGNAMLNRDIISAQVYLSGEQLNADYAVAQQLAYERDMLRGHYDNINRALDNMNSYPELDRSIYALVLGCAGSRVALQQLDYDRTGGVLIINAEADSVTQAAIFVGRLRASNEFDSISYYGYMVEQEGQNIRNSTYAFTTTAVVTNDNTQTAAGEGGEVNE